MRLQNAIAIGDRKNNPVMRIRRLPTARRPSMRTGHVPFAGSYRGNYTTRRYERKGRHGVAMGVERTADCLEGACGGRVHAVLRCRKRCRVGHRPGASLEWMHISAVSGGLPRMRTPVFA